MALAEAAAEEALAEAPPPPDAAPEGPAELHPAATRPAPATAFLAFTRLATCVRQTMLLESRFATAHASLPGATAQSLAHDTRRAPVRHALLQATEGRSDRGVLRRVTDDVLDRELAADPLGTIPEAELIGFIKSTFNLLPPKPAAKPKEQAAGAPSAGSAPACSSPAGPTSPEPTSPEPTSPEPASPDPANTQTFPDHPWPWPPHPKAAGPPAPS